MEWTVGISPWGEGTGEGETPSPQAGTRTFLLKVPAPPFGGAVRGDTQGKTVSRDTNPRAV